MYINCWHSTRKRCTLKQIPLDRPTCIACEQRCPREGPKCATIRNLRTVEPIPRDQWPWTVRIVAKLATDADAGVGSTLKRLIAHVGGNWFEETFKTLSGRSCGCSDRAKHLDKLYPY